VQHSSALPSPGPVNLQLLGAFALRHGESVVAVRKGGQRLLAFLTTMPGPVTRSHASGALWPGSTQEQASASLRATLSRLPRPGGVNLIDSTSAGPAGHAQTLLGSDLLPLWDEDWVLIQRERRRQARLHALERLSIALRGAGRWEEALEAALAAVAGEPLRESAHQRVIEVHLAEGNPAEALRQFEIYRRILHEELGLRPSDRLRHLLREFRGESPFTFPAPAATTAAQPRRSRPRPERRC
jgi:DNA-binding SARP family transcriptional activator